MTVYLKLISPPTFRILVFSPSVSTKSWSLYFCLQTLVSPFSPRVPVHLLHSCSAASPSNLDVLIFFSFDPWNNGCESSDIVNIFSHFIRQNPYFSPKIWPKLPRQLFLLLCLLKQLVYVSFLMRLLQPSLCPLLVPFLLSRVPFGFLLLDWKILVKSSCLIETFTSWHSANHTFLSAPLMNECGLGLLGLFTWCFKAWLDYRPILGRAHGSPIASQYRTEHNKHWWNSRHSPSSRETCHATFGPSKNSNFNQDQ